MQRRGDEIRKNCETFPGFIKEAWHVVEPVHPLLWGWALDAMAEHVGYVLSGQILRLLMNVPPGMMKSLMVCVFAQAYEWGPLNRPSTSFLSASWNGAYATRDSRKTRDLISSAWYRELWPHVNLTRTAEDDFANSAFGTRVAKPFNGLTSGRADRLVWDDPHSTETAESDAELARTTRILRESVPTRINDPVRSAIIGIMQRLRENDCSGVIEQLGLPYVKLVLPMEMEVDRRCHTVIGLDKRGAPITWTDPRTVEGELLFPERFPRDTVEREKISLGAYGVAGQFQQRPVPREGGQFKRTWFPIVEAVPAGGRIVRGWDLAASDGKGDWTVGLLMKAVAGVYYILDVIRFRSSPAEVDRSIKTAADQDVAAHGSGSRIRLPQDPGQAGKAQKASHATLLAGHSFRSVPVTGDKATRARPFASQAEAGNVRILKGSWNAAFLDEIGMFPNGAHDDQVDAAADAFNELVATAKVGAPIATPIIVTGVRPSPG